MSEQKLNLFARARALSDQTAAADPERQRILGYQQPVTVEQLQAEIARLTRERDEAQAACLEWDVLHRQQRQRADAAEAQLREREVEIARLRQGLATMRERCSDLAQQVIAASKDVAAREDVIARVRQAMERRIDDYDRGPVAEWQIREWIAQLTPASPQEPTRE